MKRIKIQFPIFVYLTVFVNFDPVLAGTLKQLWNKLKYDNQRLDYYQPYSFNYPASPVTYPTSLSNFNVINTPLVESSSLQRPIVSLPNLQSNPSSNLQQQSNLQQTNLQSLPSTNVPSISLPANSQQNLANNLMTSESINNQQFSVLPQQLAQIQHLSPEFLYDYNQKPGYSLDALRSLNGLSQTSGLSLTSLTPLLLLSSLGTLSSKSLAHAGGPLTPTVSNGFIRGLTTYLSSYLPSSPRQRKRQIDRNLPINPKSFIPFDQYTAFHQQFSPLSSSPKVTTSSIYGENFKKQIYFNKKKPVKYVKPEWKMNKKVYNLKKKQNKNQIKYSKLMNESGFVSKSRQQGDRLQINKFNNQKQIQKDQQNQEIKYSEPDRFFSKQNEENKIEKKEKEIKSVKSEDQTNSRSNDQQIEKVNDKPNHTKLNEESSATEFRTEQEGHLIELTSNHPDNLEDIAEMYSKNIKRITSKSNDSKRQTNKQVDDEKDV